MKTRPLSPGWWGGGGASLRGPLDAGEESHTINDRNVGIIVPPYLLDTKRGVIQCPFVLLFLIVVLVFPC